MNDLCANLAMFIAGAAFGSGITLIALIALFWRFNMTASVATIQAALSAETQDLVELGGRIQGITPDPTAVVVAQSDLDAIQASIEANTTTISNLAPPPAPKPAG